MSALRRGYAVNGFSYPMYCTSHQILSCIMSWTQICHIYRRQDGWCYYLIVSVLNLWVKEAATVANNLTLTLVIIQIEGKPSVICIHFYLFSCYSMRRLISDILSWTGTHTHTPATLLGFTAYTGSVCEITLVKLVVSMIQNVKSTSLFSHVRDSSCVVLALSSRLPFALLSWTWDSTNLCLKLCCVTLLNHTHSPTYNLRSSPLCSVPRWETGRVPNPSTSFLPRILMAMRCLLKITGDIHTHRSEY